jgi:hypothetical protein
MVQVRAALVKYGPLSIALNASWLQFYFKGIFNPPFCSDQLNHAVLLVGMSRWCAAIGHGCWAAWLTLG